MSAHVDVVDAIIEMAEELPLFATVTRGSLPSGIGITCETSVGQPSERFMDKDSVFRVVLVFNCKHHNLKTAFDTLGGIMTHLTRATVYPEGENWQIVQVLSNAVPTIVTREETNEWIAGCSVAVEYFLRGD